MTGQRRLRILSLLAAADSSETETQRLCDVCTTFTQVTGAGIMLMSGDIPSGSLCTTDEVSALIEELQYSLGEGPCVDAYLHGRPVLEPNLADPATPRWLAFAGSAVEAGARAVFGFPLRVGSVRLGALNLYRDQPGPLSIDQYSDALVAAAVVAQAILLLQADAPPGQVAVELEACADFSYQVHQAAGMIAVQLETTVTIALIRLRACAFANNRLVSDVAADIVSRSLRFDADSDEQGLES